MQVNLNTQNDNTNHQSFGAKLNISGLDFEEHTLLGGSGRWKKIKKIFQEQTKNDNNSYIVESHRNHQGLATVELFKKVGNSKIHINGYGGANYTNLVSLSEDDIAGKLINLIV